MVYDIIIVGSGISGAVLAERYANEQNLKVLVIEKRNHIGGNCYDFYNSDEILVPQYGPHFFHTNDKEVWDYVSLFTKWYKYEHRVLSNVNGIHVPVPVNINTINILFNQALKNEKETKIWLASQITQIANPKNSEESAISRVGRNLYELMFKGYTKKQWDLWPKELDASVMNRIPVRYNYDDRYFSDTFQAMPLKGYHKLFFNMLSNKNITVLLGTDYFNIKDQLGKYSKLYFTGRIDRYFDYLHLAPLQYRSLYFKYQTLRMNYFQSHAQINYPNDHDWTRITEPKHATGQVSELTTIIKEYSTWDGEPYYPVPNIKNEQIYASYKKEAIKLERQGIYFVGRLANYKYYNMDQAFRNALDVYKLTNSR